MRKLLIISVVLLVVTLGLMFGLMVCAIQVTKEIKVQQGVLVTPSAGAVLVGSSQFYVGPNGELLQRDVTTNGDRGLSSAKAELLTVANHKPLVKTLETMNSTPALGNYSRMLSAHNGSDDDCGRVMRIDASEANAVIDRYTKAGVSDFVVLLPNHSGIVTAHIQQMRRLSQTLRWSEGGAGPDGWEAFCEDVASQCLVIVKGCNEAEVSAQRLDKRRALMPASGRQLEVVFEGSAEKKADTLERSA